MFDITKLAATETSTVELVGGDDAPLYDDKGQRLSITVYGPGTKVYQRAQSRQQNLLVDKIKKRGKMDQTAEEKLAEQAEFLAACTVSFNHFTYPPARRSRSKRCSHGSWRTLVQPDLALQVFQTGARFSRKAAMPSRASGSRMLSRACCRAKA